MNMDYINTAISGLVSLAAKGKLIALLAAAKKLVELLEEPIN